MKKSLVALAALSAISAFADVDVSSGIKLYGVLDQAYMRQSWASSPTTGNPSYGSGTGFFAAGATSRLGVRGARDLGDGLKGTIQVEMELKPDEAGLNPSDKNRGAFVGLEQAGAGSIRLGTQETTAYELFAMDVNGRVEYKPQVWRYTASSGTQDRANNAIKLTTAEFMGFSASLMKGFGEINPTAVQKTFNSFGAKYNGGNLQAALVRDSLSGSDGQYYFPGLPYEGVRGTLSAGTQLSYTGPSTTTGTVKRDILGVSYDMGVAKFNYIMANSGIDSLGKLNTNTVGVRVPYEKAAVAISFGRGSYTNQVTGGTNATAATGKVGDITFGAYYNFDKSTSMYLLASEATHTNGNSAEGHTNSTAIGLQFKF